MSDNTILHQWFDQVWNNRDDTAIDRLMAPHARIHGLSQSGEPLVGPAAFKPFRKRFLDAFTSINFTVDEILSSGDRLVARFTFNATHTGDSLGIPATGQPVRATGIVWIQTKHGQINEGWNEFDFAGLLKQLQQPASNTLRT